MSFSRFKDVASSGFFDSHARNAHLPNSDWQHQLVGCFLTKMNKNSFFLRNALKYRWKLSGELSVSKLGRGFYLIKFESSFEYFIVLRQGTRVIYGDTFMFQPCNFTSFPDSFEINTGIFEITIHKMYPEQTRILNVIENTQHFGVLTTFNDPIHHHDGYSTMKIRLRIDVTQPLQFHTTASNDRNTVNKIDFIYQELPILFCRHCHRLGHEHQNCIDVYLLNHQALLQQNPPQVPIQTNLHALGPFIEPEYDDDYHQEMLHNIDIDEPDTDWSDWISTPIESHAISDQDRSEILFVIEEGYRQEGFQFGTCSESSRFCAET